VIAIAQLARTVSIDFKFPEHINQGLSALTRSTKEAALLLSGSSFRSMADETPRITTPLQPIPLSQPSLSSLLSPMSISPLTISPNYTPAVSSPSVAAFPQATSGATAGLNKFDATIVQMKAAQALPGADPTLRNQPPPPIVSIPLPRE
jgi:hypothetical protein